MSENEYNKYCSWCLELTNHEIFEENIMSRNVYQCHSCRNFTVSCRAVDCEEMAKDKPKDFDYAHKEESFLQSIKTNWSCEFCSQHDGTIPNFKNMHSRIEQPDNYKQIFEKDKKTNCARIGIGLSAAASTAVVIGTGTFLVAPALASSLGALGVLGSASTGVAINTLSGAALANASLAAIGGGAIASGGMGMGAGTLVLAAIGSAIGAYKGLEIGNAYYNSIEGFGIRRLRNGTGPAIVLVNGFLQQTDVDAADWLQSIAAHYKNNPVYLVTWESKKMLELGSLLVGGVGKKAAIEFLKKLAVKGSKSFAQKLNPLKWADIVTDLIGNPWHTAMTKAGYTGVLLAEILARTNHEEGFILMGHSLGARVIYYLLNTLSTKREKIIKEVHLLGGAIDRTDNEGWKAACSALDGQIINYYSKYDESLKFLYKGANALQSDPIGLDKITRNSKNIVNINCSDIITGKWANHMSWKTEFGNIIDHVKKNKKVA